MITHYKKHSIYPEFQMRKNYLFGLSHGCLTLNLFVQHVDTNLSPSLVLPSTFSHMLFNKFSDIVRQVYQNYRIYEIYVRKLAPSDFWISYSVTNFSKNSVTWLKSKLLENDSNFDGAVSFDFLFEREKHICCSMPYPTCHVKGAVQSFFVISWINVTVFLCWYILLGDKKTSGKKAFNSYYYTD